MIFILEKLILKWKFHTCVQSRLQLIWKLSILVSMQLPPF